MTKNRKCHLMRRRKFLFATTVFLSLAFINGCAGTSGENMGAASSLDTGARKIDQHSGDIPLTVPKSSKQQFLLGSPQTIFTEKNFVGAGRCALCHAYLQDKEGLDMSINNHWRSTMMANAAKDPLWRAKVVSETSRNPAIKQVIEEKCVTCHMPMAWTQLNADPRAYGAKSAITAYDAFADPASPLHDAAFDGVSCSLCHQIQDQGLGAKKSFSGKFGIDTVTPAPDRPIFGPYKEVVAEPMRTGLGFTPVYGSHTNDSALCAACHTLYTPFLDSAGNIAGEFPEQTPYLEWLHSEFGEPAGTRHNIEESVGKVRTCQECHMPHSKAGGVLIAMPSHKESTEKDHFSQHHFVGGNVFMLNILQDNLETLEISAPTKKITETKKRTAVQLQQQSASLSLIDGSVERGMLTTSVVLESKVGHKFPTGFPSRRAWIHFTVRDSGGAVIFESGGVGADGTIAGDDGDEKMSCEPHYDLITGPDQVQIYESVMQDTDGKVTFTLLRASGYIKDNRLLPKGFDKLTAPVDIAVKGEAATDGNFIGGSDLVTYQVPIGGHPGPFRVTAELLYTTLSRSFMQDLGRDGSLAEVKRFVKFYDDADKTPVTVVAATGVIR